MCAQRIMMDCISCLMSVSNVMRASTSENSCQWLMTTSCSGTPLEGHPMCATQVALTTLNKYFVTLLIRTFLVPSMSALEGFHCDVRTFQLSCLTTVSGLYNMVVAKILFATFDHTLLIFSSCLKKIARV